MPGVGLAGLCLGRRCRRAGAPALYWPPAGIALGALLLWGTRALAPALAGTALAAVVSGWPAAASLALAAGVAVQALAGRALLRRAGFDGVLERPAHLAALVLYGGVLAGLAAAPLTGWALLTADGWWEADWMQRAVAASMTHAASVLVFGTAMLCVFGSRCRAHRREALEAGLALAVLVGIAVVLSQPAWFGLGAGAFRPYLLVPALLWLALRADIRVTALGLVAVYTALAGNPTWAHALVFVQHAQEWILPIHGFVVAVGLSFLTLSVLVVQRRAMEAALRRGEARFRNILDLTRNCLWETDADGRFSFVDRHAATVFGLPAERLVGRTPWAVWPGAHGEAWRSLFARARATGAAETVTMDPLAPPGGERHLETSCVARHCEALDWEGWQGITRDVSERVALARDLDQTSRYFRMLAAHIDALYWVARWDMLQFHYISQRCEDIIGLPAQRLFEQPLAWQALLHDDDRARMDAALAALRAHEPVDVRFRIWHPRRGLRWLHARSVPFDGEEALVAGIVEDVTASTHQDQERWRQALAQRDTLIREVHHRIKNNLQTVVSLLRREAERYPQGRAMIDAAVAQVQSVAVVHGLHARLSSDGVLLCELLPAVVGGINQLTGTAIQVLGVPAGAGGLRIKDSETVAVALILNELLTNAVKHGRPPPAPLPVATLAIDGAGASIEIVNTGRLPSGFDYRQGIALGTGLGLVRALMSTAGLTLSIAQRGAEVVARLELAYPVLEARNAPAPSDASRACSPG
jgi:PAS domain S-box-containing protein